MKLEQLKDLLPGSRVLDRTKNVITTVIDANENVTKPGETPYILVEGAEAGEHRFVSLENITPLNGMNEAFYITEPLRRKIEVVLDAFRKDVIPRFSASEFQIESDYHIDGEVTFRWNWSGFDVSNEKTIHRSPTVKTEEVFLEEIKAYLFDLVTMTVVMKKFVNTRKF